MSSSNSGSSNGNVINPISWGVVVKDDIHQFCRELSALGLNKIQQSLTEIQSLAVLDGEDAHDNDPLNIFYCFIITSSDPSVIFYAASTLYFRIKAFWECYKRLNYLPEIKTKIFHLLSRFIIHGYPDYWDDPFFDIMSEPRIPLERKIDFLATFIEEYHKAIPKISVMLPCLNSKEPLSSLAYSIQALLFKEKEAVMRIFCNAMIIEPSSLFNLGIFIHTLDCMCIWIKSNIYEFEDWEIFLPEIFKIIIKDGSETPKICFETLTIFLEQFEHQHSKKLYFLIFSNIRFSKYLSKDLHYNYEFVEFLCQMGDSMSSSLIELQNDNILYYFQLMLKISEMPEYYLEVMIFWETLYQFALDPSLGKPYNIELLYIWKEFFRVLFQQIKSTCNEALEERVEMYSSLIKYSVELIGEEVISVLKTAYYRNNTDDDLCTKEAIAFIISQMSPLVQNLETPLFESLWTLASDLLSKMSTKSYIFPSVLALVQSIPPCIIERTNNISHQILIITLAYIQLPIKDISLAIKASQVLLKLAETCSNVLFAFLNDMVNMFKVYLVYVEEIIFEPILCNLLSLIFILYSSDQGSSSHVCSIIFREVIHSLIESLKLQSSDEKLCVVLNVIASSFSHLKLKDLEKTEFATLWCYLLSISEKGPNVHKKLCHCYSTLIPIIDRNLLPLDLLNFIRSFMVSYMKGITCSSIIQKGMAEKLEVFNDLLILIVSIYTSSSEYIDSLNVISNEIYPYIVQQVFNLKTTEKDYEWDDILSKFIFLLKKILMKHSEIIIKNPLVPFEQLFDSLLVNFVWVSCKDAFEGALVESYRLLIVLMSIADDGKLLILIRSRMNLLVCLLIHHYIQNQLLDTTLTLLCDVLLLLKSKFPFEFSQSLKIYLSQIPERQQYSKINKELYIKKIASARFNRDIKTALLHFKN